METHMRISLGKNEICNIKFSLNVLFLIIGIISMMISDLLADVKYINFGYADEIFCLVCALILVVHFVKGKKIHIFYPLFILLVVLGLAGNIIYDVQPNLGIAIMDAFIFCKPYILLLYMITTVKTFQAKILYNFFMAISKAILFILFFFCIVSEFYDWNMYNYLGEFQFLSGFTGTVSMWIVLLLSIIISNKDNNRLFYYILSAIVVYRTGSGLGTLSIVGLIAVYVFLEKQRKFRWYYLLFIVPICLWTGRNEIMGYLLNRNAPRFLLFYYAFVTALTFFPFGAGFATYGSTVAISHYSSLYYKYGFNLRAGMTVNNSSFLMDSYYPQIIGQLGFIGTGVFGVFMYLLFSKMVWSIRNRYIRNSCLYLFATWAVAGLGFGVASTWGCTVYVVLMMFYLIGKD